MNAPLIIIGTGLAGYMLAKEWRKYDSTTPLMMITESEGHFYSKPLLSTALANQRSVNELVTNTKQEMAEKLHAAILTQTSVTAIDTEKQTIVTTSASFAYQNLVLAVGAQVRAPSVPIGQNHLHSINHIEDYREFRQRLIGKKKVAIIGAGLVGCEFANDLIKHGIEVAVIEPQAAPVARFLPSQVGNYLQQLLAMEGVNWFLGRQVAAISAAKQGYLLRLDNDVELQADLVLSAIGLKSRTQVAQQAGITVNHGIITDQYLRTSAAHVYALGDCAEIEGQVLLFVAPILHAARALAKTLTDSLTPITKPIMPVVLKTAVCPLTVVPPPVGLAVDWTFMAEGGDVHALAFYAKQLVGFAVAGKFARERPQLIKEIETNLLKITN